ncbi:MAG TPA: hypothetical protein VEQ60_00895 [Longimicrobium sp.]|nr:hypothetical protein [Longimicrobium sp.]
MVTDENFGELLIHGLEEALAHRRAELPADKIVKRFVPPWLAERGDDNDLDDDDLDDEPESPPQESGPRNRLRP